MKAIRLSALACAAVLICACAPLPVEPVAENLDPDTGTTVAVASQPVELVAERRRGASRDPFAYFGPFETNRMGKKDLYLWVAAPQDKGQVLEPEVLCGDQPLPLIMIPEGLKGIDLSKAPYVQPAPWSGQWYFHLTDDALTCLAGAAKISIITRRQEKQIEETFTAVPPAYTSIAAFAESR